MATSDCEIAGGFFGSSAGSRPSGSTLPPTFLPREEVLARLDAFGQDHPLIGKGNLVNPDLEKALRDHPPIPEGFNGFDFGGQCPQYDDLFTVYDESHTEEPMSGQVNTTCTQVLDDGTTFRCSDTTIVETILQPATPLIEIEDGVYETQWVVNIHHQTFAHVFMEHPDNPGVFDETEHTRDVLSQMIWTMVMQELDTDGDGVNDQVNVTGSNVVEIIEESIDGEVPADLPPPPEILLPYDFQGILDIEDGAEEDAVDVESTEEAANVATDNGSDDATTP